MYLLLSVCLLFCSCAQNHTTGLGQNNQNEGTKYEEVDLLSDDMYRIPEYNNDSLEKVNRVLFKFNNEAYEWVLIPVNEFYTYYAPEIAQKGLSNLFDNLATPLYIVGNLLIFEFDNAAHELANFAVNFGSCLLLCDNYPDDNTFKNIQFQDVFDYYGMKDGVFLVLPLIGPTNVKGAIAKVGDLLFSFGTYLGSPESLIFSSSEIITQTRFKQYTEISKINFDPYITFRQYFEQK